MIIIQISEFTLRLILIFIPGFISFFIAKQLIVHKKQSLHEKLIYSLILGFGNYYIYYLILSVIECLFNMKIKFYFLESLTNVDVNLNFTEIGLVAILSIPIGFIVTALITYKVLYKIAHKFKISNKFGDIDVWNYIMNSASMEWVLVRDIENNIMYEGWIEIFSDDSEKSEVFIRDVKVFRNDTDDKLYEVDGVYLSQSRENLRIELLAIED